MKRMLILLVVLLGGCAQQATKPPPSPLVAKVNSETVDGWRVSCSVDKYTDERTCSLNSFGKTCETCSASMPVIVRMTDAGPDLTIGFHSHPGATGRVRINDNPVEYFDAPRIYGPVARRLIEQMQSGGSGLATSVTWPSKYREFVFDLSGFKNGYSRLVDKWGE